MAVELSMMLIVQGMCRNASLEHSVTSRSDCVSMCYRSPTCASIFYDDYDKSCSLVNTVLAQANLVQCTSTMQYLKWKPSADCLDGYNFESALNLCYKFYNSPMSWQDAEDRCVEDGGHLIQSDVAATALMNPIDYMYFFWSGGRRRGDKWTWPDNTEIDPNSTSWAPDHPRSPPYDCVLMENNGYGYDVEIMWHSLDCARGFTSFCQTPTLVLRQC